MPDELEFDDVVVVSSFEFDEHNLGHMRRHDLTPQIVLEVVADAPVIVRNRPERAASHMMVGAAANGRLWTIVLAAVENSTGTWRPVTGWPSVRKEAERWRHRNPGA